MRVPLPEREGLGVGTRRALKLQSRQKKAPAKPGLVPDEFGRAARPTCRPTLRVSTPKPESAKHELAA